MILFVVGADVVFGECVVYKSVSLSMIEDGSRLFVLIDSRLVELPCEGMVVWVEDVVGNDVGAGGSGGLGV